ncbi:MAG: DUF1990 family protein [Thermoanaerobaculia bacterium]
MLFRRPTAAVVQRFLREQQRLAFSYGDVGATQGAPPEGYVADHSRVRLGAGPETYRAAVAAVRRWEMFRMPWLELFPSDAPIAAGSTVVILVPIAGVWWLNAARIAYVVDETTSSGCRFGFAYGTLPGHAECGEERFLVEQNSGDASVWYDLLAFSRPNYPLVRLGYPLARRLQKRFARDSLRAMTRAVSP